ncbi:hypothetical protein Q3O97_16620 [Ralstonia pseudosolanacearum]|uniref:hypothetical protein n=1 Tax=Ralstonia pseudosolanacearum TaxID=1310165 RepID=UPI0026F7B320|nr:hypothetical protein [Ralstonia pseudosolanacearum]MDO3617474.1 hypothetical protein [Ralstonia pseudosolanacearum]
MTKTPVIAKKRHEEAKDNFERKLTVLQTLLDNNILDQYPKSTSRSSFAAWEDPTLNVKPLSRSIIYDESDIYIVLRKRMENLLCLVEKAREKTKKKLNIETELQRKLNAAEERAKDYLNQYATVLAGLMEARNEIEQLKAKVHRLTLSHARTSPLHSVKKPPATLR